MDFRGATTRDAAAICDLINGWAEQGRMLHRSLESVYSTLREFSVAVDGDQVIGCVAVSMVWGDLAEIRSLAVAPEARGRGIGSALIARAVEDAKALGIRRLFALTYEKDFFSKHGFAVIDRESLPEKVWRECLACPKADCCDEIAMMRVLNGLDQSQALASSQERPNE